MCEMLCGARVCLRGRVEVCRQSDGMPGCQFYIESVAPLEASGAGPIIRLNCPIGTEKKYHTNRIIILSELSSYPNLVQK